MLTIKNGLIFTETAEFVKADVVCDGGKIVEILKPGTKTNEQAIDAEGKYILPGLIDIHTHGSMGSDFCDAEKQGLQKMSDYLAQCGVVGFCGTTMAYDEEILNNIIDTYNQFTKENTEGAKLLGINMEGPFFNKEKKGAQAEKYIVSPDIEMFNRLYERSGETIKLIDIAPETQGAIEFIQNAGKKCVVSIAHTTADYDTCIEAFENGATHVTHIFNAMPAFNHRKPGVVGAAFDKAKFVEVISDGIHLHPAVIRSLFSWFGAERICLISDSMRACGMPNGEYTLGGQKVFMKDKLATLEDGTIAGSAVNLYECFTRAVSFGITLENALRAATINPATAIGIFDKTGSITKGKCANIVIADKELNIENVIINGKKIK